MTIGSVPALLLGLAGPLVLLVALTAAGAALRSARRAAESAAGAWQRVAELTSERDRLLTDNEDLARTNESLARLAGHDLVTGLPNRASFHEHLTVALARARRSAGHVALVHFGLDGFSEVSGLLGSQVADRLLALVGQRAIRAVRDGDLAARYGPDEFIVLLPGVSFAQDVMVAAERIRSALARPFDVDGHRIEITASLGVALDSTHSGSSDDLLQQAESALTRAKEAGVGRIELFHPSMRRHQQNLLLAESELRGALAGGEIVPWFQPVVDLRTGRIVGAEALARWVHPSRGVLAPAEFLPQIHRAGLAVALDQAMLRTATDLRRRIDPVVPAAFQVGVNLATRLTLEAVTESLETPAPSPTGTSARAHAAGPEGGGTAGPAGEQVPDLPGRGIALEITEATVVTDPVAVHRLLCRARDRGFQIALDDFGIGMSSLALVRDLPLDLVKVDRRLVRGMPTRSADSAVVSTVVGLAAKLGLGLVAEGVEDEADVRRLLEVGVPLAQGFRYSPAVPAGELEGWLADGPPWLSAPEAAPPAHRGSRV